MRQKKLFFCCVLVFLLPAMAGLLGNDKEALRESYQKQDWGKVVLQSEELINSNISENQRDLYRLLESMALFQQVRVDESIEVLSNITEQSLYFSWAKIFLSRLAYISENRWLLQQSLQELSKLNLKGDLKKELKYYEAHLLINEEKWAEAGKILKLLEKQGRSIDIYSSVLEAQALVESHLLKSKNNCKSLKKLYTQYPKHIWFESSAPEISSIKLGNKIIFCNVTDKDFELRRKKLNLIGEFEQANLEIQRWIKLSKLSIKNQNLLLAQQKVSEGHPEEALTVLQQIPNYKTDVEALNSISFAAARSGDMKLAIENALLIHKLIGFSKTGSMALYQAALWSYQTRNYESAERMFKSLKPNRLKKSYQKEVQWYIGWIRYLRGDFVAAEKSFQELIKNRRGKKYRESQDKLNYWLAMAQIQNGKREKARSIFLKLSQKMEMNYYTFLARERIKLIPEIIEADNMNEFIPIKITLSRNQFNTPYLELAPQPNQQEIEEEELASDANESTDEELAANEDQDPTVVSVEEGVIESPEGGQNEQTGSVKSEVFSQSESLLKIERAKAFRSVGLDDLARREVSDLENNRTSFDFLKKITEEYRSMGLYNRLSSLGQDYLSRADLNSNKFIYESIYPRAYSDYVETASLETNVEQSLIWGVMKAESMYRPWVKSPVGALGLMQVMPTTGKRIADLLEYKNFNPQILLDPQDAIRFGSKYLERLGKKFENSVQLVAAAYNAGPHRVSQWLYYFGYMQMDEWVEHIPFLETRNYVKRVTVNYIAYNELYGNKRGQELALIGPVPVQLAGSPETKESWE